MLCQEGFCFLDRTGTTSRNVHLYHERAVSLFLSNSLFTKPDIRKLIFHDLRIRLPELFMLSLAKGKKKCFNLHFTKVSNVLYFLHLGWGIKNILLLQFFVIFRDNPKTVNTMPLDIVNINNKAIATRSSEMNTAQDINNHLRSIDISRSMII